MANGDDTTCRYPKCKRALNSTLLYSLAALKDLGLGNGCSATDTDTDPSVAIAAKGEEITWRTSSKIDAVINTLQALPMISYLVEDGKVVKGPKAEKFLEAETMRFEQTKIEQIKFEQTVFDQNKLETKFEQTSIEQTGAECTALTVTSEAAGSLIEKVESTEKAIVFSQWTSMLDLLETPLKNAGFCYRRLDGTMSVLARDKAVSDFNTRPEVCSDLIFSLTKLEYLIFFWNFMLTNRFSVLI
jgi:SNF2 family DNA or RNA helicase